jgi:hypothetical protein
MSTRTFLVGILAIVLVVAVASVTWADGRERDWGPAPAASPHHGWYGRPCHHPGYRHCYAPRPVYVPVPGAIYVPAPAVVYASVPGAVYGGGYIGGAIAQPGWSFSWSMNLR